MMTNTNRNQMTERILDLTLEVNYLLTGEDYIVTKRSDDPTIQRSSPFVFRESCKTQSSSTVCPPHSLIHEGNNEQNILELTNQIIHLLTGEVWKHLKGQKETYKEVMMESHHPLISLDGSINRNEISGLYTSVSSPDYITKDNKITSNQKINCMAVSTPSGKSLSYETRESEVVTLRDINSPIEHIQTEDPSTHIKEESDSCEEGNLPDTDIYTPTEDAQIEYPPAHIKEESVSLEETNVAEAAIYTINRDIQMDYTSNCELASNENQILISNNIYTGTDHTDAEYLPNLIKEESVSREASNLTSTEIYTSTRDKHIDYTLNNESASYKQGNLRDSDIYTPREYTQTEYLSTHVKEEYASYQDGNLTILDLLIPTHHTETQNKGNSNCFDGAMISSTNSALVKQKSVNKGNILTSTDYIGHKCFKQEPHFITHYNPEVKPTHDRNEERHADEVMEHKVDGSINRNEISGLYTSVSSTDYVTKDNEITSNRKINCVAVSTPSSKSLTPETTESEVVNLRDINAPVDHIQTEDPSTHIKEESDSCEEGNLPDTDIYTPAEDAQIEYPSTLIKEESVSFEETNVAEAAIYTIDRDLKMDYTSKCELASNENQILISNNIYTGTDHTEAEYLPDLIKEESASREASSEVYTPTGDKHIDYTSNNESPSHKQENLRDSDIYTPRDYTQTEYLSTHVQEESASYQDVNLTILDLLIPTHHTETLNKGNSNCVDGAKVSSTNAELVKHNRVNKGNTSTSTDYIGHECFKQEPHFITHKRAPKENIISCSQCGNCFAKMSHLKIHMKIHTGEKTISGSECGKRFSQMSNLRKHMRFHTG
ncbi:oocyte zinc finger -like [Pelobates cultripes]|uniref:Oocyte zinc finger -like n=1 Tax=Pelobates cultripes TaxID=61616 RepID=A0AAD1TDB9_PELCU|nr:oocyte zinc finger -like [Pelobates cultripes]